MYIMYFMGLMMLIAAYIVANHEPEPDVRDLQLKVQASQLVAYHQAAEKYCGSVGGCTSAGEISSSNVRSVMPTTLSNSPVYSDGRFMSLTSGSGVIVTIPRFVNSDPTVTTGANQDNQVVQASAGLLIHLWEIPIQGDYSAGRYKSAIGGVEKPDGTVAPLPSNPFAGQLIYENVPVIINQ